MNLFRNEIIEMVGKIIDAVDGKLPAQNIADAGELLDHNEWGVALSLVCTQLQEHDVPVSGKLFRQIALAGEKMGLGPEVWDGLEVGD